jgi:hypothetical protein
MPRGRNAAPNRTGHRETNNTADTLGAGIAVREEHRAAVLETELQNMNPKTRQDYRNRIGHVYTFWEKEYPEYFEVGVRELSAEEKADVLFFAYKNTHDIVYEGINVAMVKSFLASRKKKECGKTCSHETIRKYRDAILWGSKQVKVMLPSEFYDETDRFLRSFLKETKKARSDGMLDENEADPIPGFYFYLGLFRLAMELHGALN